MELRRLFWYSPVAATEFRARIEDDLNQDSFVEVLFLIKPYETSMKIASIGNPNGYSGIAGAGSTIKLNVGVDCCWIEIEAGPSELAPLDKLIGEIAKLVAIIVGSVKDDTSHVIG